jgi:hypothetical protein
VWSYTYYPNGYYTIGGVLKLLINEPHFNYTTQITATPSSCTPATTTTTTAAPTYTYFRYLVNETTCAETEITEVFSYTYYANGYYRIDEVLYYLSNEPHFVYTTEISGATPSSCTPATTTTVAPTTFTISWSLTDYTTGFINMIIYKNDIPIVNQSSDGAGSFTVTSSDVVYYTISATSPDFTFVSIIDTAKGGISDCNLNSAFASNYPGNTYTTNADISGLAINYIDGCP